MAPQLIGMKGPSRRRLSRWRARATSSLPVPLSPQDQHRHVADRQLPDGGKDLQHLRALPEPEFEQWYRQETAEEEAAEGDQLLATHG